MPMREVPKLKPVITAMAVAIWAAPAYASEESYPSYFCLFDMFKAEDSEVRSTLDTLGGEFALMFVVVNDTTAIMAGSSDPVLLVVVETAESVFLITDITKPGDRFITSINSEGEIIHRRTTSEPNKWDDGTYYGLCEVGTFDPNENRG